jgi:hypothetical protein
VNSSQPVDHCRQLLLLDREGVGNCGRCGFHGHPVDHPAYSVARAQGHDHAEALALAAQVRGKAWALYRRAGLAR